MYTNLQNFALLTYDPCFRSCCSGLSAPCRRAFPPALLLADLPPMAPWRRRLMPLFMAAAQKHRACNRPGRPFCDKACNKTGSLATNPPCDKPVEDCSTLRRGPRQGFVTEGPRQRLVTDGGPRQTPISSHTRVNPAGRLTYCTTTTARVLVHEVMQVLYSIVVSGVPHLARSAFLCGMPSWLRAHRGAPPKEP